MSSSEIANVLKGHISLTFCAAVVFVLGFVGGISAAKNDIRLLVAFPKWLAKRLDRILRLPGFALFAFIFTFNSVFIFLYMLSGAAHFGAAAAVDFLTGLNVAVIVILWQPAGKAGESMQSAASADNGIGRAGQAGERNPIEHVGRPGLRYVIGSVCGVLVLMLELPAFWISIAMGLSFGAIGAEGKDVALQILTRAEVYVRVIVPMLLVSAAAETVGIRCMEPARGENRS